MPSEARIVSLVPSLTATLIDLGRSGSIVGRTTYCPAVPDALAVGGTKNPDVAAIADLRPDLVLAVKEENRREDVDALRAAGTTVRVFEPVRVDEGPDLARTLGRLAGAETAGEAMAAELTAAIASARDRAGGRPVVPAAWVVWKDPWLVAGPDTWIADVLRTCGLADLPLGGEGRYPETDPARILRAGACIVFLADEPFPFREGHVEPFRRAAGLRGDAGPLVVVGRGDLVGWYPSRLPAALGHVEEIIARLG